MKKTIKLGFLFGLFTMTSILNAQEVKINDNLKVESDGTLVFENDATVWDDLMVYPDATSRGGTNPPTMTTPFKRDTANTSQGVFLWMFSPDSEQELYFTVQLPHSYKVGTTLYPHVHWTTSAGTLAALSGTPQGTNVVWGLEYTVVAIGGVFPKTYKIISNNVISLITSLAVGKHIITPLGTISGTTPTELGISTVMVCRLYRKTGDALDTFSDPVGLLGFDIHYEKDTEGSRSEFVK